MAMRLAVAKAGASDEIIESHGWQAAVEASLALPDDLHGLFLFIARAALESIAYQSAALLQAMSRDAVAAGGAPVSELRVDGGACVNDLLMQFQADLLGIPVVRPEVVETTALGAAYAAGLAVGFWKNTDELRSNWNESRRWTPEWSADQRDAGYEQWKKAVTRTLDWVDVG